LNRMERYYDANADIGGYVPGQKDKLWWYFSARDQNILTRVPNFPVKEFETGLRNLTGKLTYALTQNNKLTAYAILSGPVVVHRALCLATDHESARRAQPENRRRTGRR
ncbi:MAG: hypothetical protein ACKO8O_02635, partial [Betaproteobacteria bacterium]